MLQCSNAPMQGNSLLREKGKRRRKRERLGNSGNSALTVVTGSPVHQGNRDAQNHSSQTDRTTTELLR
jgi:hypothetical protein